MRRIDVNFEQRISSRIWIAVVLCVIAFASICLDVCHLLSNSAFNSKFRPGSAPPATSRPADNVITKDSTGNPSDAIYLADARKWVAVAEFDLGGALSDLEASGARGVRLVSLDFDAQRRLLNTDVELSGSAGIDAYMQSVNLSSKSYKWSLQGATGDALAHSYSIFVVGVVR